MRTRSLILFLAAPAVAVPLGLAGSVLASPAGHAAQGRGGAVASRHLRTGVTTKKSTRFAGYKLLAKDGDASVTAHIVVPKVRCTKANRAIAASVGAYEDSLSNPSSANLFIGCVHHKARYFPFLTVNGHTKTYRKVAAHPGDTVVLDVAAQSGETVVEVFDQTHSFSKSRTGSGYSNFVAHPWIGDAAWSGKHGVERVPKFGEIDFTTATISGYPFGSESGLTRFNRYNRSKTKIQIKTSKFSSSQDSFKTLFKHY